MAVRAVKLEVVCRFGCAAVETGASAFHDLSALMQPRRCFRTVASADFVTIRCFSLILSAVELASMRPRVRLDGICVYSIPAKRFLMVVRFYRPPKVGKLAKSSAYSRIYSPKEFFYFDVTQ